MHDPLGVRRHQRVRYLHADVKHFFQFHRLTADVLFQAFALELLHHDERMPVVVFYAVDSADVGMVQLRSRPRLACKTLQRFRVVGQIFWNKFERHMPPQAQVLRLIHDAHTTAPKLA